MPAKKTATVIVAPNPQVVALKTRATKLFNATRELTVTDTTTFELAGSSVKDAVSIRKELKSLLDPEIQRAKADFKAKEKVYKDIDSVLKAVEDAVRDSLSDYAARQREAQAKLVEKALDKGNDVKAAAIAAKPFVPEVSGLSFTEHWHAEITDELAIVRGVANGSIPRDAITINMVFFNARAREAKSEDIGIPGVKGVKEVSSTVRT
jgi:hypothetical protein